MERAKDLIAPILAVTLITGVALISRWMSDNRHDAHIVAAEGVSHVQTKPAYEPIAYRFLYPHERGAVAGRLTFARIVGGRIDKNGVWSFVSVEEWCDWAPGFFSQEEDWKSRFQPGWVVSRCLDESAGCTAGRLFWWIQALRFLDPENAANEIEWIETWGETLEVRTTQGWPHYDYDSDTLYWNPNAIEYAPQDPNLAREWYKTAPLVTLAYTLSHAYHDLCRNGGRADLAAREQFALMAENRIRHILFMKDPACSHIRPRPGVRETWSDIPGRSAEEAWQAYQGRVEY